MKCPKCQFENPEDRTARFICILSLVSPDGEEKIFEGVCEGTILDRERGEMGFGYDPIFYIESMGLTMAEIDLDEKNKISHRAKAVKLLEEYLKNI